MKNLRQYWINQDLFKFRILRQIVKFCFRKFQVWSDVVKVQYISVLLLSLRDSEDKFVRSETNVHKTQVNE